MRLILRLFVALLAGVLMSAAFEPVGVPVLGPVAVAGLIGCLSGRSLPVAALIGWVFGIGFMGLLLGWLGPSIGDDARVALTLVEAGWLALTAVGLRLISRLPWWPLWAAGVWTSVELVRGAWPFGGFPWGRLGHVVVESPWESALPYVGITGTTYVLALIGAIVVWACDRGGSRRGFVLTGVIAASLLPAAAPYAALASGTMTIAVVQGGVPGAGNQVAANGAAVTRNHVEATQRLVADIAAGREDRPDLVLWPENSTAVDPFSNDEVRADIDAAASALDGIPMLVGAIVDAPRPDNVLNQGIVWTDEGPTTTRYTKHHPVPFGEYIPFRSLLGGLSGRLEQVPRDMLAGTGSAPMRIAGVAIADAICFDIAHDDVLGAQVRNGAEVVVVQTSNATFIGTPQLDQQFAITRARALETGRSVVVASLNGISGVVRADGSVQRQVPGRTTEVFVAEVALSEGITPAVRAGVVPAYVVVLSTVAALGAALLGPSLSGRRRADDSTPATT